MVVLIVGGILVRDMRAAMRHAREMHESSITALDVLNDLHYQTQEARRSMLYALTTTDSNLQVQYADGSRVADARVAEIVEGEIRRSRQLLNEIGAKVFGVVLNNVNLSTQDNYYYYQSYNSHDSYRPSEEQQ